MTVRIYISDRSLELVHDDLGHEVLGARVHIPDGGRVIVDCVMDPTRPRLTVTLEGADAAIATLRGDVLEVVREKICVKCHGHSRSEIIPLGTGPYTVADICRIAIEMGEGAE